MHHDYDDGKNDARKGWMEQFMDLTQKNVNALPDGGWKLASPPRTPAFESFDRRYREFTTEEEEEEEGDAVYLTRGCFLLRVAVRRVRIFIPRNVFEYYAAGTATMNDGNCAWITAATTGDYEQPCMLCVLPRHVEFKGRGPIQLFDKMTLRIV